MFKGIVEEMGTVRKIEHRKNLSILTLQAKKVVRGTKQGDSISVDGACLTVRDRRKNLLIFDIMRETLLKTALSGLKKGSKVNLHISH